MQTALPIVAGQHQTANWREISRLSTSHLIASRESEPLTRFVEGQALATVIQDVCRGQQVRCAVAFWGRSVAPALFGANLSRARVICNLDLGGTNPVALSELGAPSNDQLRHHLGLHAKVFLSDRGVVTASANASRKALGREEQPPSLVEAGVHSAHLSDHWKEADRWFEELWRTSSKVDKKAVTEAAQSWRRAASARALLARQYVNEAQRLSDLLKRRPAAFGDISFIFTNEERDEDAVLQAIKQAEKRHGRAFAQPLQSMDAFTDWGGPTDVPARFIAVHRGPQGGNWAVLASPGYYDEGSDIYFARTHRLTDSLFSELQKCLSLGAYQGWGGYRLGGNHFSAAEFHKLVGQFHSAEDASEILQRF